MERGYVKTSSGQVHYFTAGSGEAVLLLHQVYMTGASYSRLAGLLAPHYRVIAPDLPGFGGSDPFPGPFELGDLVRVAVDVLDGLGVDKVRVSGHRTGATVACELAVSHPDRVVALAPSSFPYRLPEERRPRPAEQPPKWSMHLFGHKNPVSLSLESDGSHLSRIWQQATTMLYHGKGAPGVVMFPPENLPPEDLEFVNDFVVGYLRSIGRQLPTMQALQRYDPDARLPLVKAPTLIIQPSGPFEPPFLQRAEMVQKLVPGSKTATIPNGDMHMIHFKAGEMARVLLDFFGSACESR